MKKLLGISLLAIIVGLTGCSSGETSSKEKGSDTEAKAETKVQNREDVKLADNEILVIDEETGDSEKVETNTVKNEKTGFEFKLPAGYTIRESKDSVVHIEAPYSSTVDFSLSGITDENIVELPTFDAYLGSSYDSLSVSGKFNRIDVDNYPDDIVQENVVYLVSYEPKNNIHKKVVAGLFKKDNKFYDFFINLGDNQYSDGVASTAFGIFAAVK